MTGDRVSPNNAALFMCRSSDEPGVRLAYSRDTVVRARDYGLWQTMDSTLRMTVPAMVDLGRLQIAATLLGDLATLETALLDDPEPMERADSTLRAALGADLARYRAEGRAMSKPELVDLALAQIDAVLGTTDRATQQSADTG